MDFTLVKKPHKKGEIKHLMPGEFDYTKIGEQEYVDSFAFVDNKMIVHHKNVFKKCIEISRAKCADYAGDLDTLANFRMCEQFGVPLEKGIMVRLSDKISRIGRLLDNENKVLDETIEDSILDGINYLNILHYALEDKKKKPERYTPKKITVKQG